MEPRGGWSPESTGEVGKASLDREVHDLTGFNRAVAETAASIFPSLALQRFSGFLWSHA